MGRQCIYIQSRRGRRFKNPTLDSTRPLGPNPVASDGTPASSNVQMQLNLDADLLPDFSIDDNDAVFDSVLFNPSYPFTPSLDFPIDSENLQSPGILRQYQCDHDM